jgi:hypothetical protein
MDNSNNNWNIKTSSLIIICIVAFILSEIFGSLLSFIWPTEILKSISQFVPKYLWYISSSIFVWILSWRKSVNMEKLIGTFDIVHFDYKSITRIFPLFLFSFGAIYIFIYPLSFVFPNYIHKVMSGNRLLEFNTGYNYLAVLLYCLELILIAPVFEEIFFRGFLLTSIAKNRGIFKAIIISSILFGVLHLDLIGSFVFGIVSSIFYLKTKSLFSSIIFHSGFNAIVVVLFFADQFVSPSKNRVFNLKEFQNYLWVGIVCFAIGISWVIYYFKNYFLKNKYTIPYSHQE